jgi:1-acyl-sn-glycerol-3-phosphate acyltransferase
MSEFEDIRPYRDEEVPAVVGRLARDPALIRAAAAFAAPSLSRWLGPLVEAWIGFRLRRLLAPVGSVGDFQRLLAVAFAWMIEETTDGFTFSGIEHIDPATRYLFMSNHRDIALDSAFVNYALHLGGHPTVRLAIGDNLLETGFAADIMRLNKAFLVKRNVAGKAAYAAMLQTSKYIRHSLEEGESVWIAQREGRAKDGWDRTDAAIIKMLALAFRKEAELAEVVSRLGILPVAISYELDPCDLAKARELSVRKRGEVYEKQRGEDLASVVTGVSGAKGRVHLHFGTPLSRQFADAEGVAAEIDRQIVQGYRLFPNHLWAAAQCGTADIDAPATCSLATRLETVPQELREMVLLQYANPVRRARELGFV